MWIRMLDTYSGSAGLFLKDMRYDVPADLLKLLPKGSYKKSSPPWDDKKDAKMVRLLNIERQIKTSKANARHYQAEYIQLTASAGVMAKQVKLKQTVSDEAAKAAKKEKIRGPLVYDAEQKAARFQLAHSELGGIIAKAELARLTVEKIERQIGSLEKKLKAGKAKPKAESEPKTETEAESEPKTETEEE